MADGLYTIAKDTRVQATGHQKVCGGTLTITTYKTGGIVFDYKLLGPVAQGESLRIDPLNGYLPTAKLSGANAVIKVFIHSGSSRGVLVPVASGASLSAIPFRFELKGY